MITLKQILNLYNHRTKFTSETGISEAYKECATVLQHYINQFDDDTIIDLQCDSLTESIDNGTMEKDLNSFYPNDDQSWIQGYAIGFIKGCKKVLE